MQSTVEYQKDHLQAIQKFYDELNRKTNYQFSVSDVIIAWFTEGYAETFRKKFIKQRNTLLKS